MIFTSALRGQRVSKVIETAIAIADARKLRIQTADLNKFIETLPHPPGSGDVSIMYATQYAADPPSFVFFVNDERYVRDNFARFVENRLREAFGFMGSPVRISFKGRKKKV